MRRVAAIAVLVPLFACGEDAKLAAPASSSSDPAFSTELELRDASGAQAQSFSVGQPIAMVLRVRNGSQAARRLTLPTSQVFDFEVADRSSGARVWHWSHEQMFATVVTEIVFEAGETKEYSATWDQTADSGTTVPQGEYRAAGFVNTSEPGLRSAAVPLTIH